MLSTEHTSQHFTNGSHLHSQHFPNGSHLQRAFEAYGNRDFQTAVRSLSDIIQQDPAEPRWLEMRAQVSGLPVTPASALLLLLPVTGLGIGEEGPWSTGVDLVCLRAAPQLSAAHLRPCSQALVDAKNFKGGLQVSLQPYSGHGSYSGCCLAQSQPA
jgi:hypothetical protein